MKNFAKVFAAAAAVGILGLGLMLTGFVTGGPWAARQALRYTSIGGRWPGSPLWARWADAHDDIDEQEDWRPDAAADGYAGETAHSAVPIQDPQTSARAVRLGSYEGLENLAPQDVAGAASLDFELLGARKVELLPGDGFGLYSADLGGYVNSLRTVMDGDRWEIDADTGHGVKGHLIIVVPRDMLFDSVELDVGAGGLTAEGLTASRLEADVDAGSLALTGFWADTASFSADAGSLEARGTVSAGAELDASAGAVTLTMPRPAEYRYDVSCTMGTVTLDGEEHSGMDIHLQRSVGGGPLLDIDCEVGSVDVIFE